MSESWSLEDLLQKRQQFHRDNRSRSDKDIRREFNECHWKTEMGVLYVKNKRAKSIKCSELGMRVTGAFTGYRALNEVHILPVRQREVHSMRY